MKNNTDRNAFIFDLWDKKGLTFSQIADTQLPFPLSLKRIRNIVYAGRHRITRSREREIYRIFRLQFLKVQDVHQAILFAFKHQPPYQLGESNIRKIIRHQLKLKRNKNHGRN